MRTQYSVVTPYSNDAFGEQGCHNLAGGGHVEYVQSVLGDGQLWKRAAPQPLQLVLQAINVKELGRFRERLVDPLLTGAPSGAACTDPVKRNSAR